MSWLRKFAEDLGMAVLDAIAYWLEPVGTPRDEARIDTDPTGMGDEGPEQGRKA